MKTQRQKAVDWWNTIGATKQNELALDYYGSTLIMDDEVEFIWLREVPQKRMYSEEEITNLSLTVMSLGMDLRQNQLSGYSTKSGKEVLEEFLSTFFAPKNN